jgi:flagellar basal-body rod protein FlgB
MLFDTTQLALNGVISGAAKRHEALATNVANANTPGYQRVDVDFQGALASAIESGDAGRDSLEHMTFSAQRDGSGAVQADGSTVDAEREAANLAQNALLQQSAVMVAMARVNILRTAMGAGGR